MENKSKILLYRGIGNSREVLVRGHYFKKYPVRKLSESHGKLANLKQAYNRFRLRPFKHRKVCIRVGANEKSLLTGRDGYFEALLPNPGNDQGWFETSVYDPENEKSESGTYIVPDETSPSVISDIDDTVLISHSTRFLKKMRLVLFKNAHSRKITKSIQSDDWMINILPEKEIDSYFYVSSSEWNLYDFLADFFELKGLPKGPFFLQRLKTSPLKLLKTGGGHHEHKHDNIRFLLDFYPSKQFYLLGDSGQRDIHIYMDVVNENPGRIMGVLIRKIRENSKKSVLLEAEKLFSKLNIPFHAFTDEELNRINIGN